MKIICIGRNYAAHAEELAGDAGLAAGSAAAPQAIEAASAAGSGATTTADAGRAVEPIWFLKPDTALLRNNDPFYIPAFSQEVHYECELVVRIDRVGRSISEKFAHRYYNEVALGIDFTARDLQREAIAQGLPWERAKAFDRSAALAPRFIPLSELGGDVQNLRFELCVDGRVRQRGCTADMLFSVDRIIAAVSQYTTLRMGDLIFTGTPAGVGPVAPGNCLTATLEGHELLNFDIK